MVADFGLARDIYESGMYETTTGVSTLMRSFCCLWRLPERSVNEAMNDDWPLLWDSILGLSFLLRAILVHLATTSTMSWFQMFRFPLLDILQCHNVKM